MIWGPFTKPLRNRRGSAFIIAPHVSPFSARNGVLIITRRINPRELVGTHLRVSFRVGVCESASKIVFPEDFSERVSFLSATRGFTGGYISRKVVGKYEEWFPAERSNILRLLSDVIKNHQHFARKSSVILHREVSGRSREDIKLFFARLMWIKRIEFRISLSVLLLEFFAGTR